MVDQSDTKYKDFQNRVDRTRDDLVMLLRSLKAMGLSVVGVSAPAKGMTLLNYCKIGRETLDYITEISERKVGRFTPGTHIPIVPEATLIRENPDYALILAWNWAAPIKASLRKQGYKGKLIIPLPEVTIE